MATPLPALVLLPGMDGTGELFGPLVAQLPEGLEVHVVRYPVDESLGHAELEARVRRELPPDRPFVLVGESFSGPIAVSIAAQPPANLAGLVLCCSFVRNPRPGLAWLAPFASWIPFGSLPTAPALAALLGRDGTPVLRRLLHAAIRSVATRVLQSRLRSVVAVDVSVALRGVAVPVLSLRASEDRVVPPAASVRLLSARQASDMVLAGPHCLLQANADECAVVLLRFLRDVGAQR